MDFTKDPNDRRRIDREAMNQRDEEIWQRRQRGESFRSIGRAFNMAVSRVQRCLARAAKRHQQQRLSPLEQELNDELDAVLARYDDSMRAEAVTRLEHVEQCNELERHRLRYFDADSPQRRALWEWSKRHPEPPREPTIYPIGEQSWRAGVDAATADDSGTDADDWW